MQPMERKNIQNPDAKHKCKENGKNIEGWWEGIEWSNKKAARQQAKRQILKDIE